MLLDQKLVDTLETQTPIVMTPVNSLTQIAVAAQIRVVRFAADDE